jgi:hypothetical protein
MYKQKDVFFQLLEKDRLQAEATGDIQIEIIDEDDDVITFTPDPSIMQSVKRRKLH